MNNKSLLLKNYISYIDGIICNNKVSHAYLFELSNYDNDFPYILDFVKMILCNVAYDEINNIDTILNEQVNNNEYPDLKVIEPIGNNIRKSQLVDLQKDFSNTSLLNGKRIYIIKNAEKLNTSSSNTLLKFLEEPSDNVIAILVTTNRYNVLRTILSRCQVLSLRNESLLFNYDDDFVDFLCYIMDPKKFFINYKYMTDNFLSEKNKILEFFSIVENCIICYFHKKYNNEYFDDKLYNILNKKSDRFLLNCLSLMEKETKKLVYNVNYKLWIDSFLSKMILEVNYD